MKLNFPDDVHHTHDVNLPTQDVEGLIEKVGDVTIAVVGFYMVADVARHILKVLIK